MGEVRVDGLPVHLSETDWAITRGGPTLGQHNEVVYGDLLGLSGTEIGRLRDEVANQLLASVALAVGTTMLINSGRAKVAWVTLLPLAFLSVITLTAGYQSIRDNFWPLTNSPVPATYIQGYVDSIAMAIMLVCAVIIFGSALRRWMLVLTGKVPMAELAEALRATIKSSLLRISAS